MLAQIGFWTLMSTTLTAGVVAAFNPCGFAMLPAYLSYFLGLESDDETDTAHNARRGLVVGLTLTAGFVLFFGLIGLVIQAGVQQGTIFERIPWVTLVFGILIIPLGLAMIFGFEPKINIPRLQKGGRTTDLPSIFVFGVSYAAVSLSCTAPIFLGTVVGSFTRESFAEGMATFFAYAGGMGLVIIFLTMAMALARNSVAATFRKALPYVNRVSGVLLAITGVFLIIYARWELSTFSEDGPSDNGLVDWTTQLQANVTNWVNDFGGVRLALFLLVAVGLLVGLPMMTRRGKAKDVPGADTPADPSTDRLVETAETV